MMPHQSTGVSLTVQGFVLAFLPGEGPIDELTMERAMEALERQCHDNMNHAIETVEGLGIEYDEDVICDVCRSPDSEEGNDMVFCDKCNICVHQVNRSTPHRAASTAAQLIDVNKLILTGRARRCKCSNI